MIIAHVFLQPAFVYKIYNIAIKRKISKQIYKFKSKLFSKCWLHAVFIRQHLPYGKSICQHFSHVLHQPNVKNLRSMPHGSVVSSQKVSNNYVSRMTYLPFLRSSADSTAAQVLFGVLRRDGAKVSTQVQAFHTKRLPISWNRLHPVIVERSHKNVSIVKERHQCQNVIYWFCDWSTPMF